MPLSDRDIALFARDCVAEDSLGARDEAGRRRRLQQAQACACSYYAATQRAVQESGYRVTPRVKARIWDALLRIQEGAGSAQSSGDGPPTIRRRRRRSRIEYPSKPLAAEPTA